MKIKQASKPGGALVELGCKDAQLLAQPSPLKLKHILVPVDFSPCSAQALQYALALGKRFKASVTLLHVAEIASPGYEFGATDFRKMETVIRQRALTALAGICGEPGRPSAPIQVRVRSGWPFPGGKRPPTEIIQAAKDWATDLIVIGTHGRTGLDQVLLGSMAERVVRHAPCPVLVVREHEHQFIHT